MKKLSFLLVFLYLANFSYSQNLGQVQRGQRGYTPPIIYNDETYIELVDPYDEVNRMMPKCVSVLGLDAFEEEIIKSMLIKKFESQNAILQDEKNTRDDRKKKIDDLEKEYLKELSTILKPDEIIKYQSIDFTETNKEKKKRRKKNKNE